MPLTKTGENVMTKLLLMVLVMTSGCATSPPITYIIDRDYDNSVTYGPTYGPIGGSLCYGRSMGHGAFTMNCW